MFLTQSQSSGVKADRELHKVVLLNFALFCLSFSICHATVDGVLAVASTELGPKLGSFSGFVLYIFYTFSSLFLCKPFLGYFSSKLGVFVGLSGMLCYVSAFLLAIFFKPYATPIFLTGAAFGGIGAGILWTSQSSYYSSASVQYAEETERSQVDVKNLFSSIFAASFMTLETAFKMLLTLVYVLNRHSKSSSWQIISFSFYVASAFASVLVFGYFVYDVDGNSVRSSLTASTSPINGNRSPKNNLHSSKRPFRDMFSVKSDVKWSLRQLRQEISAVCQVMLLVPRLQLLIPFQVCFGFSAGFVDYYVNRVIVASFLGEGYIGLFSALATLSAAFLAYPFAMISNQIPHGKWGVMIFGNICFLFGGLPILIFSTKQMENIGFLVIYFFLHGAARGVWESLNKAVVAEYFPTDSLRDAAFASVYFTSGLSGAIGFIGYQYMNTTQLALLNTIVPMISLVCYHFSYVINERANANNVDQDENILNNTYGPLHYDSQQVGLNTNDDCWTNELEDDDVR